MNKLGIKVGDIVTWGNCWSYAEVLSIHLYGIEIENRVEVSFSEPNLKIVKKFKSYKVKEVFMSSYNAICRLRENEDPFFSGDTYCEETLKTAGVLYIWCEKIYEETPVSMEEKYGFELINKEMWVWDGNKTNINTKDFVFAKILNKSEQYIYIGADANWVNASLENPNT